jgi:hypothetical protein
VHPLASSITARPAPPSKKAERVKAEVAPPLRSRLAAVAPEGHFTTQLPSSRTKTCELTQNAEKSEASSREKEGEGRGGGGVSRRKYT